MTVLCTIGGSKLLTHMNVFHGTLLVDDKPVGIITDRLQLATILDTVISGDKQITSASLVREFPFLENVARLYPQFRRSIMTWEDDSALQPKCFIIRDSSGGVSAVDEKHRVVVPMVGSFYMFCDEVMLRVQQDSLSSFEGANLIKKAASLSNLPDKKTGECFYLLVGQTVKSVLEQKFNNLLNHIPPEKVNTTEATSVLDTIEARQSNTVFVHMS